MKVFVQIIVSQFILCAVSRYAAVQGSSIFTDFNNDEGEYIEYPSWESLSFETRQKRSEELPRINFRANCTCGVRPLEQKIVGGQLADDNIWPWAVALVYMADPTKPVQFCGSSLINTQYLLTASHCAAEMVEQGVHNYQAFLGTNAISDPTTIRANLSQVKMHPNFNSTTLENDIALIKLAHPVIFSGRVHPICLKQAASPYVGLYGVVVGWGSVQQGGSGVDKLRQVKVGINIQVINNVDCATNYSAANVKITGVMMCASLPSRDSCNGDSGGPFMIWNPRSKIFCQMGIVSFGIKCASPFYPGVYARVNSFIKWIQSNTQDASYCLKSF